MAKYTNRLQVSVSDKLYSRLKDSAEYSGASVPEYVRYVLMKEMERDYKDVVADEKLSKSIKEGIDDFKKGKTKNFDNVQEAIDYLDEYMKRGE
jgi:tryptophan synthase beta subunit